MTLRPTAPVFTALCVIVCAGCARQDEPRHESAREGVSFAKCTMCGMNSGASEGRFIVDFEDGERIDACSGPCAASVVAKHPSAIYKLQVYGHDTGRLIDGKGASYVLGADRIPEGSMAPAVFAFGSPEAARAFVAEHGGRVSSLAEVLAMARPAADQGEHRP